MPLRSLTAPTIAAMAWLRHTSALVLLFSAGCSPIAMLDATVPTSGYRLTRSIPYAADLSQTLDVYRPTSSAPPAPVVIFFYGGAWQSGSKSDFRFVGQALASRGFLTVLPDVRLYPQTTFPGFVSDGAQVVRWTREHAAELGGDGRRIFLMGHSSGAHIAALLTLDPKYLQDVGLDRNVIRGAVCLSGPYDFVPRPVDRPVFEMQPGEVRPIAAAEPIECVDGRAPPMLLVMGLKDTIVDPNNTVHLAERIHQKGGPVQTIYDRNLGHVEEVLSLAWAFRWLAPTLDEATRFMHETEQRP